MKFILTVVYFEISCKIFLQTVFGFYLEQPHPNTMFCHLGLW
jgi:hypothetical protein